MKKAASLLACVFIISVSNGQNKTLWQDFVDAKTNGTTPVLPDFSYAGYQYSEVPIPDVAYKVFNVVDYGAIPNDTISDKKAIIDAIAAAEANGEGIIFFPSGKYYINTTLDNNDIISITSSRIVFRGENQKNTILFFENDLPPTDPSKLWTCPFAITVTTKEKDTFLSKIVADASRESYSIGVRKASNIKKGDWITIAVENNSPDLIAHDISPLTVEKAWTSIRHEGVKVRERHQVVRVEGNQIKLYAPIHYDIKAKHDWEVSRFAHLNHIGFEQLTFEGNWKKKFVHHRSAQDDGGWSILLISKVVNSWVRDCTFRNVSRPLSFSSAAMSTALNITIEGSIGHSSVNTAGSTGMLLAKIKDAAGMHHAAGVGGGSNTATVIWRSEHPSHTSFEAHASQPRTTLFDNVSGGFFQGRAGGARKNLPNHGRNLVLWNYEETDAPEHDFNFIASDSWYWRIVPPIIVGFHGSGTTFNKDQVQVIESLGSPVKPESLFEAQLTNRLGVLPNWIEEIKK